MHLNTTPHHGAFYKLNLHSMWNWTKYFFTSELSNMACRILAADLNALSEIVLDGTPLLAVMRLKILRRVRDI